MAGVAVLCADGVEAIECLTHVDVLRRGGVRASLVSIMETRDVVSSQQIPDRCVCGRFRQAFWRICWRALRG